MKYLTSLACTLAFVFSTVVAAQTDATFTYQGELSSAGEPAIGAFDLEFSLWDAPSGGNLIGVPQLLDDTPVEGGLFNVQLDFGPEAFDNSDRWLGITVNGITLDPRQPITRTPYAIQTRGIFVDADNDVGIGTTTPARSLDIKADEAVLRLTSDDDDMATVSRLELKTVDVYGVYTPLGALSFLGADDTVWGSISGAMVAGSVGGIFISVPTNNVFPQLRILGDGDVEFGRTAVIGAADGRDSCFQLEGGNFGIGTESPTHPLHVVRTDPGVALRGESDADWGTGVQGHATSSSGEAVGVYGESLSANGAGAGVRGTSFNTGGRGVEGLGYLTGGYGVVGTAYASSGVNYGVYGDSYSTSGYDFYAAGVGQDWGSSSSIRWKRNIESIDDPLGRIDRLRGVYFDWDAEHGGHHDVGMIAEEVGKVLPEIVTYEENGIDAHGMDYSKLTPLLVEAVNALRAEKDTEIDSLRAEHDAELAELKQRISDLEHLLEQHAVEATEGSK